MSKFNPDTILSSNWNALIATLSNYTEDQVKQLIEAEQAAANRTHVLKRLHARYTKLRAIREREEILK